MKKFLPAAVFLGFWAVLQLGGRANFFRDPGTFWHSVVGSKILREGFFDRDPFTFTFAGRHWIPHQWLGEVLMAAVESLGGLDGLLTATTVLLAALYATVTLRMLRTGLHPAAVMVIAGLALAASASHFHVRPHLATIVGVALTQAFLNDVELRRRGVAWLGWLVPAYCVWVNTHGGVLGGLTSLALVGGGWLLIGLAGRGPVTAHPARLTLVASGLASGAVTLANPYGLDLPRTWLAIMNAPHLPEIIREHARTDWANPTAWPVALLGLGYVLSLASVPPREWRIAWLLPLFWLLQAGLRVRHAPLFAVSATLAWADLWPHTRLAARLAIQRPDLYSPPVGPTPWRWNAASVGVVLAVLVGSFALQSARVRVPLVGTGWAAPDQDYWPTSADAALADWQPSSGQPNALFNDYLDGGYVIKHFPGYRVFVDDRCELFGDDWLVAFVRAGESDPTAAMERWQAEYGPFAYALTREGTPFDAYFAARPALWQPHPAAATTPARLYRRR